jgi:hypothetical protein
MRVPYGRRGNLVSDRYMGVRGAEIRNLDLDLGDVRPNAQVYKFRMGATARDLLLNI